MRAARTMRTMRTMRSDPADTGVARDALADGSPALDAGADAQPSSYADEVLSDAPVAYFRLGEKSGTQAKDEMSAVLAGYVGAVTLDQPGAIRGDTNGVEAVEHARRDEGEDVRGGLSVVAGAEEQPGISSHRKSQVILPISHFVRRSSTAGTPREARRSKFITARNARARTYSSGRSPTTRGSVARDVLRGCLLARCLSARMILSMPPSSSRSVSRSVA